MSRLDETALRVIRVPFRPTRRAIVACAGVATTSALLAACSASGGGDQRNGAAGAVVPPGTVLRLYDNINPTDPMQQPLLDALKLFTQKTGIAAESEPQITNGKWDEVLLVQVAAGTAPDVSLGFGDELFNFVDNDTVVDVTARVAKDVPKAEIEDWVPSQYAMFRKNGRQFAFGKYCGTFGLAANKELFQQNGVALPDDKLTWSQFIPRLAALTKKEGDSFKQIGLVGPIADLGFFLGPLVWAWGGEVSDPKDNSRCLLD